MKDLLLVIDMQKVYEEGAPWACRQVDRVADNIDRLLKAGRAEEVLFTRFDPPVQPVGQWAEYNRENAAINADTRLAQIVDTLAWATACYPVYSKSTYSSLSIPQLAQAAARADRVLVSGVVAECCVLATVMGLIDAGSKVVYLTDAVAGQTETFEQTVQAVVGALAPVHTRLMTVEEYLAEQT